MQDLASLSLPFFYLQTRENTQATPLLLSGAWGLGFVGAKEARGVGKKEEEDAGRVRLALTRPEERHRVLSTASDIAGGDTHTFQRNDGTNQRISVSMSI